MRALSKVKQALVNHVYFIIDGSYSMHPWRNELISVVDDVTRFLAENSKKLDQETRITVYIFSDREVWCIFYDMDVLRLPSIKGHYRPDGGTPLLDAQLTALDEMEQTAQLHGDHAFLGYLWTDGEENRSHQGAQAELERRFRGLPENWTNAILVPNQRGREHAERFGFPADNIAIWEPTSAAGIQTGARTVQDATERYMTARSVGTRGTRTLFSTGVDAVNDATVKSVLTPLKYTDYTLIPVGAEDIYIKEFVEKKCGLPFAVGRGFYQLTKSVKIQPQKEIVIVEKATDKAYGGRQARGIIGLPDMVVTVKADKNPQWDIYVQSTAPNRKLLAGTKLLYLNK